MFRCILCSPLRQRQTLPALAGVSGERSGQPADDRFVDPFGMKPGISGIEYCPASRCHAS
jgi:hypothetical protein